MKFLIHNLECLNLSENKRKHCSFNILIVVFFPSQESNSNATIWKCVYFLIKESTPCSHKFHTIYFFPFSFCVPQEPNNVATMLQLVYVGGVLLCLLIVRRSIIGARTSVSTIFIHLIPHDNKISINYFVTRTDGYVCIVLEGQ